MTELTTELHRGAELAGYRIEAVLGRGGMGVVYLAEQLRLKRRVALKLLAPELAEDERFRERFLRESELAASLDHPNVLPVFDAGEADGRLYIAMRYVEGTDLGTLLAQEGRLDPERAVAIVGAVAAGLDAAHARGLVHRDVKPANVLLAHNGHVYLADFGLTRSAQEGSPDEKPHLSGTLEYVAPEQIDGELPDPAADVYALGGVLYHCLAGEPPFPKDSQMALLWAHFNEQPPSLHQRRPELPAAIDPVIATALAKEPGERYTTGSELAAAAAQALGLRWMARAREWDEERRDPSLLLRGSELRAAEAYLDAVGRGAEPAVMALQQEYVRASRAAASRRQRLLVAASIAVAVAAIALLVFALVSRNRATSEARRADASAAQAREAAAKAQEAAAQAKTAETAQVAQRLGAQALLMDELGPSLLLARQSVELDDSPQTRGDLLAALLASPAALRISPRADDLGPLALSPDGRRLAVGEVAGRGRLFFFDGESLDPSGDPFWPPPTYPSGLAYSPDGRTLAVIGPSYLLLLDAATGRVQPAAHSISAESGRVAYSPDGKLLATAETPLEVDGPPGDWLVVIRDAVTGAPTGRPLETGAAALDWAFTPDIDVAFMPDGRSVLTSTEGARPALVQWDLESRLPAREFTGTGGMIAVSPDGSTVAVGREDGTVALLDLGSGSERATAGRHGAAVTSVTFNPDGTLLGSTSDDGTAILWDVASGALRETFQGHARSVQTAVFSGDGKTLYTASHDGTVIAWDAAGDRRLGRLFQEDPSPDQTRSALFSLGGELIAIGLNGSGIRLRDAHDLDPMGATLEPTGGQVESFEVSADGRTLAALTVDGNATAWDVESRSLLRGPWTISPPGYPSVGVTPDGTTLAVAGAGGVELWDIETGVSLGRLTRSAASDVSIDPSGALIAFGLSNSGEAEVWDVARRARITTVRADRYGLFAVALSPDGNILATEGWESIVRLWDTRTGAPILEFDERGTEPISTLDFSPDGRRLAVAGGEGTVTLWDVEAGTLEARLDGRASGSSREQLLTDTDFSRDGKRLLMTLQDGRGIVWDVDPESWKRRACDVAHRTLTQDEWDEFLPGRRYEPACTEAR